MMQGKRMHVRHKTWRIENISALLTGTSAAYRLLASAGQRKGGHS